MWLFLSRRIRRWLILAVVVPLVGKLVHRLAVRAQGRDATSRSARWLTRADTTLARLSRRNADRSARR